MQDTEQRQKPNRQRVIVCPSSFRAAVENYCKREGISYKRGDCADTSRICPDPKCGKYNKGSSARIIACTGCGRMWDRDDVGAINILNRGLLNDGLFADQAAWRAKLQYADFEIRMEAAS
jgi:transposase